MTTRRDQMLRDEAEQLLDYFSMRGLTDDEVCHVAGLALASLLPPDTGKKLAAALVIVFAQAEDSQ